MHLREETLIDIEAHLPDQEYARALTDYLRSVRNLHAMCTAKELGDYKSYLADFRQKFMVMFENYNLSWTLKIHVILDHYSTYFEITGKTMRHTNGEFPEGAHSTLRKHEERHGFEKVKKGLGSQGHVKKSARSLSQLNSRKIGSTPPIRLRASPFSSPLSSFSPSQTTASYSFSPSSFSSPPPSTLTSFSPFTPSQLSSFSSPTPSSQIVYPLNQF